MGRPRSIDPTGKTAGTGRVNVRISPAHKAALEKLARRDGVTVSEAARRLMLAALDDAGEGANG